MSESTVDAKGRVVIREEVRKKLRVAGVSLWRFLDELRKRNVALKYSMGDAESEILRLLARRR